MEPFLLDGEGRAGDLAFGAQVPVGGIFGIPFLAVEVGVDPGAIGVRDVLDEVVGLVPAAGAGEPECAQGVGEFAGGWRASRADSSSCSGFMTKGPNAWHLKDGQGGRFDCKVDVYEARDDW